MWISMIFENVSFKQDLHTEKVRSKQQKVAGKKIYMMDRKLMKGKDAPIEDNYMSVKNVKVFSRFDSKNL